MADPIANALNSATRPAAHVADWSALRLFNQYRLVMLLALAAIHSLPDVDRRAPGTGDKVLFQVTHSGYFTSTLRFIYLYCQCADLDTAHTGLFHHRHAHIVFLSALLNTSGGASNGFPQ